MFSVAISELMITGIHFAHQFSLPQQSPVNIGTSVYVVFLYTPSCLLVGPVFTPYILSPQIHSQILGQI